MPKLGYLLLVVLAGSGCVSAGSGQPASAPAPLTVTREPEREDARLPVAPREGAGDLVIARVGGAEIRRSDVGDFAIRYFRDQASEALTHLVDERIIAAEAREKGITVSDELVSAEVDLEVAERENTVRVQYGPDVSLERFLKERYGVTLEGHRRDLRRLVVTRLLRDRVIRYQQCLSERVEVRDAVFATESDAQSAAISARKGADLGALAREKGVRKEVVLPPVPRDELSPKELSDAVFALPPGGVSGAIAVREGDRTLYHVFKLVKRYPARNEPWSAMRDEIESGLAEKPLEPWEYLQWAGRMRVRYRVEALS